MWTFLGKTGNFGADDSSWTKLYVTVSWSFQVRELCKWTLCTEKKDGEAQMKERNLQFFDESFPIMFLSH